MPGAISAIIRQLSGLVVLSGCIYMAVPAPKTGIQILPSVKQNEQPGSKPQNDGASGEAQEFMSLPPHIQRQVLDYARNWIDGNFERVERCR